MDVATGQLGNNSTKTALDTVRVTLPSRDGVSHLLKLYYRM